MRKNGLATLARVAAPTAVGLALGGCLSVPKLVAPVGVQPLPYAWSTTSDGESQLCRIAPRTWPLRWVREPKEEDCRKTKGMDMAARNELQHELLGTSSQECQRFKNKLYSMTKGGVVFGAVAQLSSAASSLIRVDRSAGIASSASTVAGAVGSDFDGYFRESKMEIALAGIELARTRVFKQLDGSKGKAVKDYPVSRAVNDAFRYHNVCTLSEGIRESKEAVQSVISKEQGQ